MCDHVALYYQHHIDTAIPIEDIVSSRWSTLVSSRSCSMRGSQLHWLIRGVLTWCTRSPCRRSGLCGLATIKPEIVPLYRVFYGPQRIEDCSIRSNCPWVFRWKRG